MRRSHLLAGAIALGLTATGVQVDAAVPVVKVVEHPAANGLLARVAVSAAAMGYSQRNLQILLAELGYSVGTPDGVVGPKTRAAISAFQTDARLPVSGEPSLALFAKLQEAVAKQGSAYAPAPTPSPTPTVSADLVAGIQGELSQRGYAVPSINGRMDTGTVSAIRSYQAAAGLAVTGEPSQSLLTSLQSAPRSAAAMSQVRRDQVTALQRALNQHGYDAGPEDGVIGPKVRTAVRSFQSGNGMRVTGEVTPELLVALGVMPGGTPTQTGSTTTPTTPTSGSTTTAFGLDTDELLQLEQALTALGYKAGKVDGVYDNRTRNAILNYQGDNAMSKDGLATPSLLAGVNANLASRTGASITTVGRASALTPQQVWNLQQSLGRQGYYIGGLTGVYDSATQDAVRAYQRAAGLPVTGVADASLLARLKAQ